MRIQLLTKTLLSTALIINLGAVVPAQAKALYEVTDSRLQQPISSTYEKLLPLQGGSNFRDLGGYTTDKGKTVKRGLLFRSGNMANLTDADMAYLNRFNFKTIVDLRSNEELELYPNRWAKTQQINYINTDYSISELMAKMAKQQGGEISYNPAVFYAQMPKQLAPQLKQYFERLVAGDAPIVVNCAAGQDRTGIASGILLSALGVPRETVLQDYLLSTESRRPAIEMGGVDLAKAAKTNTFAKMMLRYQGKESSGPAPLITEDRKPYLAFALDAIDQQYGSVPNYLKKELGISDKALKQLHKQYLD